MKTIDTDYLEIFFEVSAYIQRDLDEWYGDSETVVTKAYNERGAGSKYELAEEWSNEFKNVALEDGEWFEAIFNFCEEKNRL